MNTEHHNESIFFQRLLDAQNETLVLRDTKAKLEMQRSVAVFLRSDKNHPIIFKGIVHL